MATQLRQGRMHATQGLGHSALLRDAGTIAAITDFLDSTPSEQKS
jgi:hypothetical protein